MAQIIKIIEETLPAGTTTLTVTDTAIPYSIIAVNCDKYGTYPADMTVTGNVLTLTYEAQTEALYLAISLIKADLAVIDGLTSDSQTDALSAAQGKALKTLIDNIVVTGTLAGLDDVDLTGLTAGDILVYDAEDQKWINSRSQSFNCDIITNTSGQFSTITGGLLQSCVIDLTPIQTGSGNPSPENVRPITGHSSVEVGNVGKNRQVMTVQGIKSANTGGSWSGNVYTINGGKVEILTDSDNNVIGFKVSDTFSSSSLFYTEYFDVNGNYLLSGCPSGGSASTYRLDLRNSSNGVIETDVGNERTVNNISGSVRCVIRIEGGYTANNLIFKPMICLATDTDATFEPYLGKDYTISLGQTVYGGSLDVVSGVLTVDKGYADFGSLTWTYDSVGFMYSADIASYIKPPITVTSITDSICSHLEQKNAGDIYDGQYGYGVRTNGQVRVRYSGMSTNPTTFKSDVNGWLLVYELATPLTIQLTPQQINTLIGENNISIPLTGQSIDELTYREVMAWPDVKKAAPASAELIKYQATMSSNPYGWFTFVDENGSTLSPANGTPVFASCFDGSHYYSGIFVQADANTYVFKVGDINISPLALSTSQLSNLTFNLAYIKAGE